MGLGEQWLREQQHADDLAETQEMAEAAHADALRKEFNDLIAKCDLDAETSIKCAENLYEVFADALCESGTKGFKAIFLALLLCHKKGNVETIPAIDIVREHFVSLS
jgi:hypothetical protein